MSDESAAVEVAPNPADEVALSRLPALDAVGAALGLPEGALSLNGLQLSDPDTTFDQWQGYGHLIGAFGRWHRFALGDWLLFGEALFGEDSAQAVEGTAADRYDVAHRITGLTVGTLQNYASICSRIPITIRRVELDFSTHEPVAALDRGEQIYWLEQAVVNGWDRAELRQAIKESKNPPSENGEPEVVDGPATLTRAEQIEFAAQVVWSQGQTTDDGGAMVPPEAWSQLGAALGDE